MSSFMSCLRRALRWTIQAVGNSVRLGWPQGVKASFVASDFCAARRSSKGMRADRFYGDICSLVLPATNWRMR
jgi:hypothetical protein